MHKVNSFQMVGFIIKLEKSWLFLTKNTKNIGKKNYEKIVEKCKYTGYNDTCTVQIQERK